MVLSGFKLNKYLCDLIFTVGWMILYMIVRIFVFVKCVFEGHFNELCTCSRGYTGGIPKSCELGCAGILQCY